MAFQDSQSAGDAIVPLVILGRDKVCAFVSLAFCINNSMNNEELETLASGDDGTFLQSPCHEEEMDISLCQGADGAFYLHRYIFDADGNPVGNIKTDLTNEQAVRWRIRGRGGMTRQAQKARESLATTRAILART